MLDDRVGQAYKVPMALTPFDQCKYPAEVIAAAKAAGASVVVKDDGINPRLHVIVATFPHAVLYVTFDRDRSGGQPRYLGGYSVAHGGSNPVHQRASLAKVLSFIENLGRS